MILEKATSSDKMSSPNENYAGSTTRLIMYEECPFMFYKKEIEKIWTENTLPLALGSATHEAIEYILKGQIQPMAIFNAYIKYVKEVPELPLADITQFVENAPYEQFINADVTVERRFLLPLDENGEYWINGVIDVADNRGQFLADWKTNRKVYKPTDTRQLALYSWALSCLTNTLEKPTMATLYFLRFYKQQKQSHMFMPNEKQEARIWALNVTKEINNKLRLVNAFKNTPFQENVIKEQFCATPSNRCTYCPFAVECYSKFGN